MTYSDESLAFCVWMCVNRRVQGYEPYLTSQPPSHQTRPQELLCHDINYRSCSLGFCRCFRLRFRCLHSSYLKSDPGKFFPGSGSVVAACNGIFIDDHRPADVRQVDSTRKKSQFFNMVFVTRSLSTIYCCQFSPSQITMFNN